MGCWNKTCGLTNLPIMYGEKTYVFVLEKEQELTSHCYATHLYRPLLLPFISTYNDYGAGEDSGGPGFPLIMDGICKHLVELSVGENEYHDIAVTKDAWGEQLFFEAVHEDRLRINRWRKESHVSFVMMRKDVVDDLMDSYEFEEYLGENQGTHGWKNSYQSYKWRDVIDDVDEFFDTILREKEENPNSWLTMSQISIRMLYDQKIHNLAAKWLRYDADHRYSNIVMIKEDIMNLVINGQRDQARTLVIEHLRGIFVDQFMDMTRKSWIPGGHEGSQSQDFAPYRALIASMNKSMDAQGRENNDDECDDD